MNKEYAVILKNVSKIYNLKQKNKKELKFYALKDVSFNIQKGEVVGILGTNGSGKSTLSSIISGISSGDSGKVIINGEQSLISINTGLNNQLTGIENIEYKGALLGLSKSEIKKITEGIKEFTELGKFLEQPVKNYSSGMKSRLGFGISIYLNPDIIIIDEALSVGDSSFEGKCINKIEEFKNAGKTIFFVSHSLTQVKKICNKGLWIEGGILKGYGDIDEISKEYSGYIEKLKKMTVEEKKKHNEDLLQSRIVSKNNIYLHKNQYEYINKDSNKKLRNKNKKIKVFLGLVICLTLVFLILGNFINSEQKKNIVNELTKEYSFIFATEKSIDSYKDEYRTYLNDFYGNVLDEIVQIKVDKNGKIYITKIPSELQVYYKKLKVKDEVRFIDLFTSKTSMLSFFEKMQNVTFDDMFILNNEKLNELILKDDLNIDISEKLKILLETLSSIKNSKREIILNEIIKDSVKDKKNYINEVLSYLKEKELEIEVQNLEVKEIKLIDEIDSYYIDMIINTDLLNKSFIVLQNSNINNNVYYDVIKNEIYEIEGFWNHVDIDDESEEDIVVDDERYDENTSDTEDYYNNVDYDDVYRDNDSNSSDESDIPSSGGSLYPSDDIEDSEDIPFEPDEEPPASDEEPPASDEEPPASDEEPPASDEEPPASDETPIIPDETPIV
nr:ATP-binding cassette domain-containing protein [uncultured Clostridium sp.]